MKYYRDVYVKGYKKVPHSMFVGREILYYTGKVRYYDSNVPNTFNIKEDFVIDCDCIFSDFKKMQKVF